ncbi:hypothetical protein DPMN_036709 [Dreissena polymorpha]|uniref:Uncharacterized protein n=1 Tax=Dreissena polymorpha TaxID=45954 RepID=A0A9D4MB84_DREPO|nr:hypothetical protein DPMN_036708 [Dreissena polymorpha]KAH3873474.1 hypothetical protein DPMN_036709 [Dreissena polymorpha]
MIRVLLNAAVFEEILLVMKDGKLADNSSAAISIFFLMNLFEDNQVDQVLR